MTITPTDLAELRGLLERYRVAYAAAPDSDQKLIIIGNYGEIALRALPQLLDAAERGLATDTIRPDDDMLRTNRLSTSDPDAEVVERVARALAKADKKDPDAPAWVRYPGPEIYGLCWRDQYADKARAAIAAMGGR